MNATNQQMNMARRGYTEKDLLSCPQCFGTHWVPMHEVGRITDMNNLGKKEIVMSPPTFSCIACGYQMIPVSPEIKTQNEMTESERTQFLKARENFLINLQETIKAHQAEQQEEK